MIKFSISFLITISIFFYTNLQAQVKESFSKGVLILTNDKQLRGYIKEDELAQMSSVIKFKSSLADKNLITLTANEIKHAKLENGEIYDLIKTNAPRQADSIFLLAQLIVKGKASLYMSVYKETSIYLITNENKSYWLQDNELIQGDLSVTNYFFKNNLYNALKGKAISEKDIERVNFDEKEFIKLIIKYNESQNSESKIITSLRKPIHFIVLSTGGRAFKKETKEFYFQAYYRTYFPSISKSTSLNIGLTYYQNKYQGERGYSYTREGYIYPNYKRTLISIPLQIQQYLLNKSVKPYLFGGVNLSYIKEIDDDNNSLVVQGLQKNFGIGLLLGAGIEVDIFRNFMIKSEFRHEAFSHQIMLGIGYNFLLNKSN